jgi:hypothetical protein
MRRIVIAVTLLAAMALPAAAQTAEELEVDRLLWCSYVLHLASEQMTAPQDSARRDETAALSAALLIKAQELMTDLGYTGAQQRYGMVAATDPAGLPCSAKPRYDVNVCSIQASV